MNNNEKLKSYRLARGLIIFGIVLALAGVLLSVWQNKASLKPPPTSLSASNAPSSNKPSADKIASYTVPPTNPKYITIPAINVQKTRVLKLGLTKNNAIAVPNNIYDAGWYDGSSLPGQGGAMFMYGHVSSWTANGVFYNLKKLKAGDDVTVTRGDNKTYTYKVVSTKIYPYNKVDMGQVLSTVSPGKPGLNLMTCTGSIIKGTSTFSQRLVVFAVLTNP